MAAVVITAVVAEGGNSSAGGSTIAKTDFKSHGHGPCDRRDDERQAIHAIDGQNIKVQFPCN
jgi:hypothetical protein